ANEIGETVVAPVVDEVLQSSGQPLDPATRSFMESRFGADFGPVRVHSDALATEAASSVAARAFTVGQDIVFGAGEYEPQTEAGRQLLAHELTHTVQQGGGADGTNSLQRTPCLDEKERGPFVVSVIGAPGPGEIKASHPYQFMNAALYQGVNKNTVWIVEQTGYEAGGVDKSQIEKSAAPGCLFWLTPQTPLSSIISQNFPDASIESMTIYSHGLAGLVTLRYGWESKGLENYGLSMSQVQSFGGSKFKPNATIDFNSCNTGTSVDEGNLAQEMAYRTGRPVKAWTGRTSYAEINNGADDKDTSVHGSEVYRNRLDMTEVYSRARGRNPVHKTFSPPGRRSGGFTSDFEIRTRLPESRHFDVPEGGMVVVTCSGGTYVRPDRKPTDSDRIGIYLNESKSMALDPRVGYESLKVGTSDIAIFTNLHAGEYYLEIIAESEPEADYETLMSDIAVDVYEP
ncbi:MAG TPA: DUF4157 domain-containing protein, partial [Pyrinomonadaceae bacterium]|nr:DUF4157 domain-containing protein [Pyrinomonadaceae bacterium]